MRNETINSFIFGEPPTIKQVPFCNQNKENIGIASEMEFPHIALIKLQKIADNHHFISKCVGSLISDRHVITSFYCVSSLVKYDVKVQLGVSYLDSEDSFSNIHDVESLETKYGVTILKLQSQVYFSQKIMPACLFTKKLVTPEVILAAWSGDWRECDPMLKKWHISNTAVNISNLQIRVDQSTIVNYRQVRFYGLLETIH